ncbi:MAG: serine protease [Planctomycetaceae bacterium]
MKQLSYGQKLAAFVMLLVSLPSPTFADERSGRLQVGSDVVPVIPGRTGGVLRSILSVDRPASPDAQPEASTVRPRGPAADVYEQVAPAVVLITTQAGHGTGFFISADGWIITNAHVVEGAEYNHQHKANIVSVLSGSLAPDGWMVQSGTSMTAIVYRVSERQDLALLKLTELPQGAKAVPFLKLADNLPKPGSDCVAIGNPGIGSLWSVRQGQVTGAGEYPRDQASVITQLLKLPAEERKEVEEELARDSEQKRVLHTNCGISGGDSGGPLVNTSGEVIAVTFAIRTNDSFGGLSLHVHLDELREFVRVLPTKPDIMIPGPYLPFNASAVPVDVNNDDAPDAILFRSSQDSPPLCLQILLQGKSLKQAANKDGINKAGATRIPDWSPNFAIYSMPTLTVLYDRNGDGEFDLVFRDEDENGTTETQYLLSNGKWLISLTKEQAVSADHFTSHELQAAFGSWQAEVGQLVRLWEQPASGK